MSGVAQVYLVRGRPSARGERRCLASPALPVSDHICPVAKELASPPRRDADIDFEKVTPLTQLLGRSVLRQH